MKSATRNRIQLAVIAILLVAVAALAFRFIVVGSVEKAEDGRTAIVLEAGERDFVLREMRAFVAGLQQLIDALSRDDMSAAAAAARTMGMAAAHDAPAALVGKLPLAFKTLGFSVHRDFDAIAVDAESLGDAAHTLAQVSLAMRKCVACHNDFRIRSAPDR